LAGAAFRQYDGELGGNIDMFGDHFDAAIRYVRNGTIARQRAGPKLDFGEIPAVAAFAFASIY
jgi:hypothetical protein